MRNAYERPKGSERWITTKGDNDVSVMWLR
jgi:hypothetical protein